MDGVGTVDAGDVRTVLSTALFPCSLVEVLLGRIGSVPHVLYILIIEDCLE
jgi:general stress protein CsbA